MLPNPVIWLVNFDAKSLRFKQTAFGQHVEEILKQFMEQSPKEPETPKSQYPWFTEPRL